MTRGVRCIAMGDALNREIRTPLYLGPRSNNGVLSRRIALTRHALALVTAPLLYSVRAMRAVKATLPLACAVYTNIAHDKRDLSRRVTAEIYEQQRDACSS